MPKNQTQNNFKTLNQLLQHPSKKAIKYDQDKRAKQENASLNPQAPIKRYVAITLVKLMKKKPKIIIHKIKGGNGITAQNCDTNTFSLFKSLQSIKFVNFKTSPFSSDGRIRVVKLTPLGKKYVKKYIPRYKQIYKYLKQGSSSMKISQHNYANYVSSEPELVCILTIILITASDVLVCTYPEPINPLTSPTLIISFTFTGLLWILTLLPLIVHLITRYKNIQFKSYRKENIARDTEKATRKSFVRFLNQYHIREPDYRWGYNKDLPKINCYLFNKK